MAAFVVNPQKLVSFHNNEKEKKCYCIHSNMNFLFFLKPVMYGENKHIGHTYLNKPAAECCRFVYVCVPFLLQPGIKGLKINGRVR